MRFYHYYVSFLVFSFNDFNSRGTELEFEILLVV